MNYVWFSNQPTGSAWLNAFNYRAHLLALQGGNEKHGQWVAEVRHANDDYQQFFGERPSSIDGVALMTDGGDATVR